MKKIILSTTMLIENKQQATAFFKFIVEADIKKFDIPRMVIYTRRK
jgi:hypothetical protein